MSTEPFLVGVKGQGGAIHLLPVKPKTFWERLGKQFTWLAGWLAWSLVCWLLGYVAGSL